MNWLLDRLMAKQQRLMQELEPPPKPPPSATAADASKRKARLAAEREAIEAAFVRLSEGDHSAAEALLASFIDTAQDTRTLTTMSRIRSLSGRTEEALDLLRAAEAIDPSDNKVAYYMAELLQLMGRHHAAIAYRRRLAYTVRDAPAEAFVRLIGAVVKSSAGQPALLSELQVALAGLRRASDVSPKQLCEAARLIYHIAGLADEATTLYAEGDPCPTSERQLSAVWAESPQLPELRDALLHPGLSWTPFIAGQPAVIMARRDVRLPLRLERPRSPLLLSSATSAVLRLPRNARRIDTPALLVGSSGDYYRDTIDHVGVLAEAERLGFGGSSLLVVGTDMAPHQVELLALLGYDESRLLRLAPNELASFERLLVPRLPLGDAATLGPSIVTWYRRRLAGELGGHSSSRRKLYLSRASASRRRLRNEDALVLALRPRGYEVVDPAALSVRQQIELFAQACEIVAVSDEALTNLVYAPPETRVTMLQVRQLTHASDMPLNELAAACGHETTLVDCEPVGLAPGERPVDADLTVDIESLVGRLR